MKKAALIIAAVFAISAPLASFAAMEHGSMPMEHGSMMMEQGMQMMGKPVHTETVDGVKAMFSVMDIAAKMKAMGMKETHHLMVMFSDAKTGKPLTEGEVKFKIVAPDNSGQVKSTMAMNGGFGADVNLSAKGRYGILTKCKLADGKVRTFKFWYTVK